MKRALIAASAVLFALALVFLTAVFRHFRTQVLTTEELRRAKPDMEAPLRNGCDAEARAFSRAFPAPIEQQIPVLNSTQLGAEEVAVYRVLIAVWSDAGQPLNISDKTFPLDPESAKLSCACLKSVDLQNLVTASRSIHRLPRDILPNRHSRLVDATKQASIIEANDPGTTVGKSLDEALHEAFRSGLFSLSEIAFDKEHQHALVGYSFMCGGLCGNGAILVFEKANGEWRKTNVICGSWMS